MARLYANACFSQPTVRRLRRLGHDISTVQQTEGSSSPENSLPDEAVLKIACTQQRVLLTNNAKHFKALHNESGDHSGIIACDQEDDPKRQAKLIHEAVTRHGRLKGKLVRISRSKMWITPDLANPF